MKFFLKKEDRTILVLYFGMKFVSKWKRISQILNNNYTKHEFRKILAISGKPGLYM
jgi:hypothetical protein